jgi:excinuclease ABC subunit B
MSVYEADYVTVPVDSGGKKMEISEEELPTMIRRLRKEMKQAARDLEFERAAELRDQIKELTGLLLEIGGEI